MFASLNRLLRKPAAGLLEGKEGMERMDGLLDGYVFAFPPFPSYLYIGEQYVQGE